MSTRDTEAAGASPDHARGSDVGRVPSPTELADRSAINAVLVAHSRGVDRADERALKAAYWSDATVEYGSFNGNAHTFCEFLPDAIRFYAYTHHAIGNVAIDLRGDEARVETYVTAAHYRRSTKADSGDTGTRSAATASPTAEPGGDTEMVFYGRYLDRFEKRGDVWKIAHRRVVMDFNRRTAAAMVETGPPMDGLARGARYPNDPLYEHLSAAATPRDVRDRSR